MTTHRTILAFLALVFTGLSGAAFAQDCALPNLEDDQALWDRYEQCVRKQQEARIGKYFCFYENAVGIQHPVVNGTPDLTQRPYVGKINPSEEKFFIEIQAAPPHLWKKFRMAMKAEIRPRVSYSEDTIRFNSQYAAFVLFDDLRFTAFESGKNHSLAQGRCERIN
ncbi:hypothetical protein [Microvirga arabica]|uniref:hypothetical protein n=1 Tax=Microvirga arabica TaxID=1128671 RepID=UPI001939F7AD|nr:hypothetical protein [Microvirga arabica]MBM1169874.1 hypothetical protein [Microvirga arabica]